MADQVIALSAAKAQGLTRYFTGAPCCRGHVAERIVSSRACIECTREQQRAKWKSEPAYRERKARWREENPAKVLETSRRSQEANRDKLRARSNAWKAANRDKSRELSRKWRSENPDAGRLWHIKNREKSRTAVRNRGARRKNAEGTHSAADLVAILKAQKHLCAYCRTDLRKTKKHVDHIHPLARGGSNDKSNLQYLCAPCNQSKGAKDPLQFAQEMGRLL